MHKTNEWQLYSPHPVYMHSRFYHEIKQEFQVVVRD